MLTRKYCRDHGIEQRVIGCMCVTWICVFADLILNMYVSNLVYDSNQRKGRRYQRKREIGLLLR